MIFVFQKCNDLVMGSKVTQGHWEWYHSTDCVLFRCRNVCCVCCVY